MTNGVWNVCEKTTTYSLALCDLEVSVLPMAPQPHALGAGH
jgi:hypothetical protein